LRGGFDVDVIHTDTGATDHAEFGCGFHDLLCDLGFRTHEHGGDV
jgi:hypothetical protein